MFLYLVIYRCSDLYWVPCQKVTLHETKQHAIRKVIQRHLPCHLQQVTSGGAVGGGYPDAGGASAIGSITQTVSGGTGPSSNYGPPGASGPY
jgi:hypothetical protein